MAIPLDLEQPIPGIQGLHSFNNVLDFVANKDKFHKRIAELEAKTIACNEAVKRVVALNALGALQIQVREDLEEAKKILTAAREKAKVIYKAAEDSIEGLQAESAAKKAAHEEHTRSENKRLKDWEDELVSREETTTAKKLAAEKDLERAETLSAEGRRLKKRFKGAVEKMQHVMREV